MCRDPWWLLSLQPQMLLLWQTLMGPPCLKVDLQRAGRESIIWTSSCRITSHFSNVQPTLAESVTINPSRSRPGCEVAQSRHRPLACLRPGFLRTLRSTWQVLSSSCGTCPSGPLPRRLAWAVMRPRAGESGHAPRFSRLPGSVPCSSNLK